MAAERWIKWQMKFPVNKCKVTYGGRKKTHPLFYLHDDGVELPFRKTLQVSLNIPENISPVASLGKTNPN